jgi:hypothetical protein
MMVQDPNDIAGHWVEVREESTGGTIVLRSFDSPVPPARGRRSLMLRPDKRAEARAPGPTDRSEAVAGSWSLDGDTLTVDASGWTGRYRIRDRSGDKLVLSRE